MRPRVLKCLFGNYLFSANVSHREYVVALFDTCFQQMCDYKYIFAPSCGGEKILLF